MKEKTTTLRPLSAAGLKLIALALMLLDHMWATLPGTGDWMTCLGRLAFPIFAFQIAEGYTHTKNFKKYLLRLFLFGLVAEVPYDLMCHGVWFDPFSQNVMFTFCWALLFIRLMDKTLRKNRLLGAAVSVVTLFVGFYLAMFTFVDYYGYGVLMVLAFWLLGKLPEPWKWLALLAAMVYINCFMMGGQQYIFHLWGREFHFNQQGFAVLALIPIWLYNGKQGLKSRAFQYGCYIFYPAHMLLLALVGKALAG